MHNVVQALTQYPLETTSISTTTYPFILFLGIAKDSFFSDFYSFSPKHVPSDAHAQRRYILSIHC